MSRPILAACYFGDGPQGDIYRRLARVLEFTANRHLPGWAIRVERLNPPDFTSAMGNQSHVWNTQKLQWWRDQVIAADDGDQVLLIDADMMILRDLSPIWSGRFDVAFTVREASRLPLNGGVVAVRVSPRTRGFMRSWWDANVAFLANADLHRPWRMKFAGINQASFGFLLSQPAPPGLAITKIGCGEWNCCEWERTYQDGQTRVVHVKSALRRSIFRIGPVRRSHVPGKTRGLIQLWERLEQEAIEWQKRRAAKTVSTAIGAIRSTSAAG